MFTSETSIRVHYALTDQMGVVYHGHYAQFYEIGRTEAIRDLGFTYKDIEAMGIFMPVVGMKSSFLRPAHYDDLLTIRTTLHEIPKSSAVTFTSDIYNEAGKHLNAAEVTLLFMRSSDRTKCKPPEQFLKMLEPYFNK